MDWPIYFKDQLILGNEDSHIGICSLWTIKELISKELDNKDYSIIGQLYSKEGIKYILRNVLSNPKITDIILIGQDRTKSGEYFLELRNSPDSQIPKECFNKFRENITIHDYRNESIKNIKKIISDIPKKDSWGEPKTFPEEKIETSSYPSERSLFKARYSTVSDAWPWVVKYIMKFGSVKPTEYGGSQKEILNMGVIITDENYSISPHFLFNEKEFNEYYPQITSNQKIENIEYTYGQRLRDYEGVDQIKEIINRLKSSTHTRRAVATTWRQKDVKNHQPPCLVLLQCHIQNEKLHMTAYFRSNDMIKAWPLNALGLSKLQDQISEEINIKKGTLTTISSSAHIYEQDFKLANKIIEQETNKPNCKWDPRGNFIIQIENDEIIVNHYSPDGIKIDEYRGKSSLELYSLIGTNLGVSQIEHAMDLGGEIKKAEICIKNNLPFKQDG